MQLSNERLLIGAELLRRLLRETSDMPAALKLRAIRLARRVFEEARAVEDLRQEMVLGAAERDEAGQPVILARDDGAVTYRLKPGTERELDRQWREVLAGSIELVGVTPLDLPALTETSAPADVVLGLLELGFAVDPAAEDDV